MHNKKKHYPLILERMLHIETEIIEELLKCLQPKNCLEWGAGFSTIHFPKFLNKNAKWIALEHDKGWADTINAANDNKNVNIFYVAPNHFPWTDKYHDGSYSDLKNYIDFASNFPKFDFILIDGRARADCLKKAYEIIVENGIVVLHDAERQYYHEPFALYKYWTMLNNYGGGPKKLWIGGKTVDITNVIDIKRNRKINTYSNAKAK